MWSNHFTRDHYDSLSFSPIFSWSSRFPWSCQYFNAAIRLSPVNGMSNPVSFASLLVFGVLLLYSFFLRGSLLLYDKLP